MSVAIRLVSITRTRASIHSCLLLSTLSRSSGFANNKHTSARLFGPKPLTRPLSFSTCNMAKILKSKLPYKGPATENTIELIGTGLRKNADQVILVDSTSGRGWTGAEIETTVGRIAKYLIEDCGLNKGDTCNLYASESDHSALILLSIMLTGATANFLTSLSSGREIHDTAKMLKSKLLLTTRSLIHNIHDDLAELKGQLRVIAFDEPIDDVDKSYRCIKSLMSKSDCSAGFSMEELAKRANIVTDQDYAVIQFSSGTTGKPKPIPRTHKNLCHLVASADHEELMDLKPGVVMSGSLPITHRPGLWALLAACHTGCKFIIWTPSDAEDGLKVIDRFKVTSLSSSLPYLAMLGNVSESTKSKYDVSSLTSIFTSGAKIVGTELPEKLMKMFGLISLRQCFGMTESGWVFLIEESLSKNQYLTVGHVCPGMEAVILARDENRKLGPMERGEIALRGPQIFPGYLSLDGGPLNRSDFTEDGWFRIGDQGYYDNDELVYIEGRYKEVMMFENNNLYFPSEIEAIISEIPEISNVCVVKTAVVTEHGYPYDIARACVTLREGCQLEEKTLLDYVRKQAPGVIIGGGMRVYNKFPRLQNGKVDKQALKLDP